MDLRETEHEKAFRAEVRSFVEANLPHDLRDRVLNFQHLEKADYVRWQRILAAHGWGAPAWPREFGGAAWSAAQRNIFDEECFAAGAPRQMPFGLSMVAPVLQKFGTPAQQQRFLPRILWMEDWWCQGYSEPGAGSDLAALSTRAERSAEGHYLVNGQKIWTSFAQWADWIFCLVRTDASGRKQEGISFLLIDMATPGVSVRPIKTLDGGHDVNEVFFDNVKVPLENLVGEEHRGWSIAKYLLGHERTNIAGLGNCKRFMRRLKEIAASERKHGKPLLHDPRFRDRIVKVEIDLIAHEWSLLRLIAAEEEGRAPGPEASILKIRGSEIQQELTELLMECAGPYALPFVAEALEPGYSGDTAQGELLNALAPHYLDWRKISIYGGATEVQKNIIAKMILGL
ncbi:acyl-CoA dehydrogenase [Herbaspirillum rubrisubalbicans]|uniref:Acyl-CoA dehydrogenase n=1 Tax=Herbaspirillum rubrisubalbicans TaxID=80842 RepID=A0ABX9C7V9_9BURK|nr:acyl-CoA dehydrogenase family protein [Herbaspirillum rubrisubalbicans]NQE47248.1 acyl-CoA dehydrogenase [Herbaspirillum rubrisubalbicans]RAM66799.1 acyl-CoA dehydrogenase [Herbaspirillum rubrisubalbicans]RAN47458.1 acyl-CoA dehydrogenase [Herbaspirillum rubrisubalbicans]